MYVIAQGKYRLLLRADRCTDILQSMVCNCYVLICEYSQVIKTTRKERSAADEGVVLLIR